MKSSDLDKLFKGEIPIAEFKSIIQQDVDVYTKLLKLKGSTIPLNFQEDEKINLSKKDVKRLCQETIDGNLTNVHLAYICDCLSMEEYVEFEYQNLKETIFELADPEIEGFKSNAELINIIESLENG